MGPSVLAVPAGQGVTDRWRCVFILPALVPIGPGVIAVGNLGGLITPHLFRRASAAAFARRDIILCVRCGAIQFGWRNIFGDMR